MAAPISCIALTTLNNTGLCSLGIISAINVYGNDDGTAILTKKHL